MPLYIVGCGDIRVVTQAIDLDTAWQVSHCLPGGTVGFIDGLTHLVLTMLQLTPVRVNLHA